MSLKHPVSAKEWKIARLRLEKARAQEAARNETPTRYHKLSRKEATALEVYGDTASHHSFIAVGEQLFCLDREYAFVGGIGKVKLAVTESGEEWIVKISDGQTILEENEETGIIYNHAPEKAAQNTRRISVKFGEDFYSFTRVSDIEKNLFKNAKPGREIYTTKKHIELQRRKGHKNIQQHLIQLDELELTPYYENQLIIIAIKAALKVNQLHAKNEIHRDIKCSNMMLTENDNPHDVDVELIDFDYSEELERGRYGELIPKENLFPHGTKECMAPEAQQGVASVETDLFSIAVMIEDQLQLDIDVSQMRNENPAERTSIPQLVLQLWEKLDPELQKEDFLKPTYAEIVRIQLIEVTHNTLKQFLQRRSSFSYSKVSLDTFLKKLYDIESKILKDPEISLSVLVSEYKDLITHCEKNDIKETEAMRFIVKSLGIEPHKGNNLRRALSDYIDDAGNVEIVEKNTPPILAG